jgi:hypothetical protein
MTSYRQIEANRRDAIKSTGPKTEAAEQVSLQRRILHSRDGHWRIGRYRPLSERSRRRSRRTMMHNRPWSQNLSCGWRVSFGGCVVTMEIGLLEMQADHLRSYRQVRQFLPTFRDVVHGLFGPRDLPPLPAEQCFAFPRDQSSGSHIQQRRHTVI